MWRRGYIPAFVDAPGGFCLASLRLSDSVWVMSAPQSDGSKLSVFIDLMRMVEAGFIHKLKAKRPDITQEEISREVTRWYMSRPGAEHGDADGVRGDLSRFF